MENLELSSAFWSDKRVLITGHTGFKGGWLSIYLLRLGAKVAGYALPAATEPSLFDLARVSDHMQSETGDVRNIEQLTKVISGFRPDIIIHMAAQALTWTVEWYKAFQHGDDVRTLTERQISNFENRKGLV